MSLVLSPQTIDILKNFGTIHQTILFPKGSTLITRSQKKHTFGLAIVKEKFPKSFCIYDLNQFLAVCGQFEKPTLNFKESDTYVKLSDEGGGLSVKYHFGDPSLAFAPDPNKQIKLPSQEVSFKLTEATFRSINNMAKTLGTLHLALTSDGDTLKLSTFDSTNSSTNTTELVIGEAPSKDEFSFVWKLDYLKLLPGTYDVSVSKKGISQFKHSEIDIQYFVMLEQNPSKFSEAAAGDSEEE